MEERILILLIVAAVIALAILILRTRKRVPGVDVEDAGDRALRPFLRPGEVFVTNAPRVADRFDQEERSGRQIVESINAGSPKYGNARIIDVAFDVDGNLIPTAVSVVATPRASD